MRIFINMTERKVILLVEDRSIILEITGKNLEDAGYEVLRYRNEDEVIREIDKGLKFDLAVVDRSLGGSIGGCRLMTYIKKRMKVPVINSSVYDDPVASADVNLPKQNDEADNSTLIKIIRGFLG